jgi:NADH-quinone oxidoreductase subunit N
MLSAPDIMSLLPMLILSAGFLLCIMLIAIRRSHILTLAATLAIFAASFIAIFFIPISLPHPIGDLFMVDRFGLYYCGLMLATAFVITIFSYISLERGFPEKRKEEFYLLLMLAILGATMMALSTHFISFFVSLEILTISLYGLISYYKERERAIEAGLKYLVLAAMSSSFLLFGMALIYAITGQLSFAGLASVSTPVDSTTTFMLFAGIGMMIAGIGFKLALVPFHIWAPDVYEGASSPVSSIIATVSKGSVVALLLRFFFMSDLYQYPKIILAITVIAILSMLIGNLLALVQNNVKRILAYSSIAHFGYLLVAVIAGKEMGKEAVTFYLTAYTLSILGAFGIVTLFSVSDEEAMSIEDYKGLFWRRPFMAFLFTVFLLSLAGIPLTAGFTGKYFILTAGLASGQWVLAFILITGSVIGLYYYLRIIICMLQPELENPRIIRLSNQSLIGSALLSALALLVLLLGLWPAPLLELLKHL